MRTGWQGVAEEGKGGCGMPSFVAIDFETADYNTDSACAVGLVKVREGKIVERRSALIRPPRSSIVFSYIHGLTWSRLRSEPYFPVVWEGLAPMLEGVEFLVAHNAPFDRRVLHGCCEAFGCAMPGLEFCCTYRLSKRVWPGGGSYKLPDICRRLAIALTNHHDAVADAEACARLMLAILEREPEAWRKSISAKRTRRIRG